MSDYAIQFVWDYANCIKPLSDYRGLRVTQVPDYVGSSDTGVTYFNYELVNKVCI